MPEGLTYATDETAETEIEEKGSYTPSYDKTIPFVRTDVCVGVFKDMAFEVVERFEMQQGVDEEVDGMSLLTNKQNGVEIKFNKDTSTSYYYQGEKILLV